jgi:uncharacterized protein (TIGR02453 family)
VSFTGIPTAALDFYEDLEADNTKSFWTAHKNLYDEQVKAPIEALCEALAPEFGTPKFFRPYRDVRFSKDKTPYKLSCAAHLPGGYVSFSADGLFVGSGLYMPDPPQLARFRAAVADDRSGPELESIVATLRKHAYDVGAHDTLKTAPKGYPQDHPRIELLRSKGLVMSKSWPVGAWLGTKKAKDRVVTCLNAARPLNVWIERCVS